MKCRGCRTLYSSRNCLLNLGRQAIVKFKSSKEEEDDLSLLALMQCPECKLVQLSGTTPPSRLFSEFHYLSGINKSMNDALFDVVKDIEKHVNLKPEDIVVDIGANDGTLLSYYRRYVKGVGFEPAKNIHRPSFIAPEFWINDYFNKKSYYSDGCFRRDDKAKVITAIAMFYDLDDPNSFCREVHDVLAEDGIFVIQMNDYESMIDNISVDNICHEHLCYYSQGTLKPILERNGLYIQNISYNNINGGSMRVICGHKGTPYEFEHSDRWQIMKIDNMWKKFYEERNKLLGYIASQLRLGKSVWGYGASTRGNTLLQLLGLDCTKISTIADRNPKKWGKFTAGGNIPIYSEGRMRLERPDNLLVLPYYFENEFLDREIAYLQRGGKMIFPLPRFRIWTSDKEGNLTVHGLGPENRHRVDSS